MFALNGKSVGTEFFDVPVTFERFLQKLLEGYAIDATEDEGDGQDVPSLEEAVAFLRRVRNASAENFDAIGHPLSVSNGRQERASEGPNQIWFGRALR